MPCFSHRRDDRPRDSWEDLRRYARAIVSGQVVGIDQGFQGGLPMSLLEVEVDDIVRSSDDYAATRTLYVAYPYAVFAVGDKLFCRDEPRFAYRPQIGDHLLLFPSHLPRDRNARMLDVEPTEILAQKPSGELGRPRGAARRESPPGSRRPATPSAPPAPATR